MFQPCQLTESREADSEAASGGEAPVGKREAEAGLARSDASPLPPASNERPEVTRRNQEQQDPEPGDERQVLADPAEHRTEQVGAVVARQRGRALDRGAEQQAGAQDRAEDERPIEERLEPPALEP